MLVPDEELVKKVLEQNCDDSLKEIAARHSALFNKVYMKFAGPLNNVGMSRSDVFNDKESLFYQAIQSFNAKRQTKFTTYFVNFARWHFLDTINHTEQFKLVDDPNYFNHLQLEIRRDSSKFFLKLPDLIKRFPDRRIRKIFKDRYLQSSRPKRWRDIAAELNLSTQTCNKLHKRGIQLLKDYVKRVEI
jgi:DNA-directed RNA polymerase sigma subunit (sigma70/sigma32)